MGTGPGRYTSLRMGLISARALSFSIGAPVAGVSTLAALAAGADGALPVIDARRREVFSLDGRRAALPQAGRPRRQRGGSVSATERFATGRSSRAAGPSSPPTTTPVTFPGHATTPGSP